MGDTPLIRITGGQHVSLCGVRINIRDFAKGDKLPEHTHTTQHANHLTIVMSGALRCFGRAAIEDQIIKTGDILDWRINEPHGFEAIEDGTRIVQVLQA